MDSAAEEAAAEAQRQKQQKQRRQQQRWVGHSGAAATVKDMRRHIT